MSMYDNSESITLVRFINDTREEKTVTITWLEPWRSRKSALAKETVDGWTPLLTS